jgi:predicted nucleic acid-binding protein
MNIVVDTNILISILMKPDGVTYDLFQQLHATNELYISSYSLTEITRHTKRLLKSSKLSIEEFENLKAIYLQKTTIISAHFVPEEVQLEAYKLVHDIDEYDMIFVATILFVNGVLWTGDDVLYKGLKAKKFTAILNSKDVKQQLK